MVTAKLYLEHWHKFKPVYKVYLEGTNRETFQGSSSFIGHSFHSFFSYIYITLFLLLNINVSLGQSFEVRILFSSLLAKEFFEGSTHTIAISTAMEWC